MSGIKLIIINWCLLLGTLGWAQNLVPNPSFEDFTECPDNIGQILYAAPWTSPTTSSPDFFHTCNGGGQNGIPANQLGLQPSHSGEGYAGFIAYGYYNGSYTEYIQAPLISPLEEGKEYAISFYLSLADVSHKWIEAVCVDFSEEAYSYDDNTRIPITPEFCNPGGFIEDQVNWTLVCGKYTAKGGEAYITIGRFEDAPEVIGDTTSQCYYYIDDVSVVETVDLGPSISLCYGESLSLEVSAPNTTYVWQDNSTDSIFNVSQDGVYWIESTVNGCAVRDTVVVSDEGCNFSIFVPNAFSPNGDGINDLWAPVMEGVYSDSYDLQLFNRWGNLIWSTTSIGEEWDGFGASSSGIEETEIFVYRMNLQTGKNEPPLVKTGYVTLIR